MRRVIPEWTVEALARADSGNVGTGDKAPVDINATSATQERVF